MYQLGPMFTPIARDSAVDRCARAIRQAILAGDVRPGECLPAERKLSESFGVTRVTVRGALARLAAAGLLEVRQGSGHWVRDYRTSGGPGLIVELLETSDAAARIKVVRDLLRMRRALAGAVLECLLELGGVDTSLLARCVDELEAVAQLGGSSQALAAADVTVVAAIVQATGSAAMGLCMNPISQVVLAMPALCEAMYRQPASNVAGYRALITWCGAPDAAGLRVMLQMLATRDAQTLSLFRGAVASC